MQDAKPMQDVNTKAKAPTQRPAEPPRPQPSGKSPIRSASLPPIPPRYIRASIAAMVLGIVGLAVYFYWQNSILYPSTDDATLQADVVRIAPLISGPVKEVNVHDNQKVEAGRVLVVLDSAPYEAGLKQAQAKLAQAQQQAQAAGANSQAAAAAKGAVEQAEAAVAEAQRQVDSATITAPVSGIVGKVRVRPGTVVQAGTTLFPLVDTSNWWVEANFKETDLSRIAAGQHAWVKVDLYPDHEFSGEVESISPASGVAFSLLPPENGTGNWVKVTQRFPVRVKLDLKDDDPAPRIGASAYVTIDTSKNSDGQPQ